MSPGFSFSRSTISVGLAIVAGCIPGLLRPVQGSTLDVDTLKRGALNVNIDHSGCGDIKGLYAIPTQEQGIAPVASVLGAPLVPPLIEAAVSELGSALVRASGKNDTTILVSGLKTSYFYCIQRDVERNPVSGELQSKDSYFLLPRRIIVSAPMGKSDEDPPAFEAQFDLVLSADGSAFKLVPTKVNYVKPIFNSRAFGTAVEIKMSIGPNHVVATGVLPLGFVSCGRPYNVCERKDDKAGNTLPGRYVQALNNASSGWLPLPAGSSSRIIGNNKDNAVRLLTPGFYLASPLTVSATLTEISTYDKFLAFWGDFLSANKSTVKESVVSMLPPLTQSALTDRNSAVAERAIAEVEYNVASASYAQLRASNAACKDQVDAWKTAVKAAIKANIVTSLESNPPSCVGGI